MLSRGSGPAHAPRKITDRFCTGDNSVARFLPYHLWNPGLHTSELKKLAVLTLAYAAEDNPSAVGKPFDIMTLDIQGNVAWSVYDINGSHKTDFDQGLQDVFINICGRETL
jgi:hypothetical protein